MKAAILGTTGYAGLELLRILAAHRRIEAVIPVSSSQAGVSVIDMDPGLHGDGAIEAKTKITGGKLATVERAAELEPEVVFAALPHLKSAEVCEPFFSSSVVIDLSADFRIADKRQFVRAYGTNPPRPDLLDTAIYGLTEWAREPLSRADLIANPGCYPTCTSIPLIPLLRDGLVEPSFWTTALSGVSGAGRSAKTNLLFVERSENTHAYSPGHRHRHVTEIEQSLERYGGKSEIFFIPHLVPLRRGMFTTTRLHLAPGVDEHDIAKALSSAYENEPFIRLLGSRIPETRHVRGTNRIDIGWHVEGRDAAVFSAIDNLVKGASGQAVQNMNVRFGFEETEGLSLRGAF
ncbi:MAG: N-acetyl-gamma-glutamyl-phosphate reductase [Spirochaetales bacterium]